MRTGVERAAKERHVGHQPTGEGGEPALPLHGGADPKHSRRLTEAKQQLASQLESPTGIGRWDYSLVGTAFDYRVRFCFDERGRTGAPLVAQRGAERLAAFLGDPIGGPDYLAHMEFADEPFCRLFADIAVLRPNHRHLISADEDAMNATCVVLAYLESCFRAPMDRTYPMIQASSGAPSMRCSHWPHRMSSMNSGPCRGGSSKCRRSS